MRAQFCPKCSEILIPHWEKDELFLRCGKCLFSKKISNKNILKTHEKIPQKVKKGDGILKEENLMATYKNKCPKCGYEKCEVLDMGSFYSDEDNLFLMKCGKCGWSERVGSPS